MMYSCRLSFFLLLTCFILKCQTDDGFEAALIKHLEDTNPQRTVEFDENASEETTENRSYEGETAVNFDDNDVESPTNTSELSTSTQMTNETKKLVVCKQGLINMTSEERLSQSVELINNTRLAELLVPDSEVANKATEAPCTVVLFYSRLCPFSSMAGPHFNALARSFPDIKMVALDALQYHSVNTQYGIVGVPTMILFHNGRPVAKFNGSEYTIHAFVKFVRSSTGLQEDVIVVHSQDFQGPVPSVPDKDIDYFLVLSWVFVIVCALYFISKSQWWKKIVEMVRDNWQEAEAQHEHVE